jgi:SAM-dependent methyltransferase
MERYDELTYGERIAEVYDKLYADYEEATVDLLHEFARGGRVLELGIGTGRIALPLYHKGVEVMGIDASASMIARMRAKPGGENIRVIQGDFAAFDADGDFDLVYVVFNTFFGLLTQAAQVRCFQNVGAHLALDGLFLLEVFVPDLTRFDQNQTVRTIKLNEDLVQLEATRHDPVAQQVTSQHVLLSEEGIRMFPVRLRYAWPSELDLMAQLAGLTLRHRWGSWKKGAFTAESGRHISVYGRAQSAK